MGTDGRPTDDDYDGFDFVSKGENHYSYDDSQIRGSNSIKNKTKALTRQCASLQVLIIIENPLARYIPIFNGFFNHNIPTWHFICLI